MIGIILAEKKEQEALLKHVINASLMSVNHMDFYVGNIGEEECVVALCGIGKVNSARATQMMIDSFKVDYIINSGVAGSVSDDLTTLDVVVGEKLVQHDFDLTAFGRELGEIPDGVGRFILSDKKLLDIAEGVLKTSNYKGKVGTIASGDRFVSSREDGDRIQKEFGAICCEMEGASIAQVCFLNSIPFIVIRTISDRVGNNNKLDFDRFLEESSANMASFVIEFVKLVSCK